MSEITIPPTPLAPPAAIPPAANPLASRARKRFGLNPVFARELRERARKNGTPAVLTIYLLLLTLVAGLAYGTGRATTEFDVFSRVQAGRQMFEWVMFALFCLISFVVPGYTAGSISGERERQTLVPLQVTLLRPRQIVFGKVLASIAYTVLLITAATPVLAFAYSVGGVSVMQVVRGVVGMVFVAFALAAIAVFWSAVFRRSVAAIVMSYLTVLVMLLGTFLLYGLLSIFTGDVQPSFVLAANPYVFLADFVTPSSITEELFNFDGILSATASNMRRTLDWVGPIWVVSGVFLLLLALGCVAIASKRLQLPADRER